MDPDDRVLRRTPTFNDHPSDQVGGASSVRDRGWAIYADLTLLLATAIVAVGLVALDAPVFARVLVGIPFVLFIPGYLLVAALFPLNEGIDGIERIALSFGLSFATLSLSALGIEYSPLRLNAESFCIFLLASSTVFVVVALIRRSGTPIDERFVASMPRVTAPPPRCWDRLTWLAGGLLVLSLLVLAGGAGAILASRMQGEPLTEFALYNAEGKPAFYPRTIRSNEPATVILEVINREEEPERYWIGVTAAGQEIATVEEFTVDDGQTWRQPLELVGPISGDRVAIDFHLYRADIDRTGEPFRRLRMFVNGDAVAAIPTMASVSTAATPTIVPTTETPSAFATALPTVPLASNRIDVRVIRVVTANELDVEIAGERQIVRVLGVDTPSQANPAQCFGMEALAFSQEAVERSDDRVVLELDAQVDNIDSGELAGYIWLRHPDGTRLLNEELVKAGFGRVAADPDQFSYRERFLELQVGAIADGRGLWSACDSFGAPLPAPTASPVGELRTHVVQPDETLIVIANQYGVSVDAILELNEISDPAIINVGVVLLIPNPE